MNYIELFAGCGGLSLGLKSVGFDLVMANELSPMAAESYAFNFLNEDLQAQGESKTPELKRTLWLSSQHPLSNLKLRLRENPRTYPKLGEGYTDIAPDGANLKGSMVVGSIVELNEWLKKTPSVADALKAGLGKGELDLVSGGPPCQSFSMAGLRRQDCEKNSLPWEFAKFAQVAQPKLVLLENVTGILRPFRDDIGNSYYAWLELAKGFSEIGYVPLCLHVNAKYAGVPQNRPRFILIGVREDYFHKLEPTFNTAEKELFRQPWDFFGRIRRNDETSLKDLSYKELMRPAEQALFEDSFLHPLAANLDDWVTVKEAIHDIRNGGKPSGAYQAGLKSTFGGVLHNRPMKNHELRSNNPHVQRRFRLYQVLQALSNDIRKRVLAILKHETNQLGDEDWQKLKTHDFLNETGNLIKFDSKEEFVAFLWRHNTKKQTQKALLEDQPAPAALSIPDDACHYDKGQLRTLTVREMARIQSFPDNFEFRSKVTTGGQMRSFEVPQYTQVGNAVPPLLGRALGLALKNLLDRN